MQQKKKIEGKMLPHQFGGAFASCAHQLTYFSKKVKEIFAFN
jgi:hypothetical protein